MAEPLDNLEMDGEEIGSDDNDDGDDDNESSEGEYIVEVEDEDVEPFLRTFHNGDYDAEFDNALCFDRVESLALPNQPTQASYNKPDNWRERNRIGLEKVKEQLQTRFGVAFKHKYATQSSMESATQG
jgi:hypothetical protein